MTQQEPVFVRSGLEYESYTDFWDLVRLSGYRTVPANEVNFGWGGTYVWPILDVGLLGQVLEPSFRDRRARLVFWYLERPDAHLPDRVPSDPGQVLRDGVTELLQWVDAVWVSDRTLQAMDTRTIYAVLGGHPGLRDAPLDSHRPKSVLHLGQETPRRKQILAEIGRTTGHLPTSGSLWGMERSHALGCSRLLLSIDRVEGLHVTAPLRYALAAAWRVPILSETVPDPYPLVQGESLHMAGYAHLATAAGSLLAEPELLARTAESAYRTYCLEWTFRRGVGEALRETVSRLAERPV